MIKVGLIVIMAFMVVGCGTATGTSSPSAMSTTSNGLAAIQQQLQSVEQELMSIRQETIAANPELKRREAALQKRILSKMREAGVQPREKIAQLQNIAQQLRGGALTQDEQEVMSRRYQQLRKKMLDARRLAMQDKSIQAAFDEFEEDRISAMTEQNSEVPAMIEQADALQEKISIMLESRRD